MVIYLKAIYTKRLSG